MPNSTFKPPPCSTLGDVLYSGLQHVPVPEQGWVKLVKAIAAGDQDALHALYGKTHRLVFTLIMRITANRQTAEELTGEVFHDVWCRAFRYDASNTTVVGWIMNMARSRAIDRLCFDFQKIRSRDGAHAQSEPGPNADDVRRQQRRRESLRAALDGLNDDERQGLEMTYFAGLTHAEAAARLNQPAAALKTSIRSALHKLRDTLPALAT